MSLYARTQVVDGKEVLLPEDSVVGPIEHLANKHRIVTINGVINYELQTMSNFMALISTSKEPIKVFINSMGGYINPAFLIYDIFKMSPVPVYTIGTFCASAATFLLAAGNKRFVMPHAKVMMHLPAGGIEHGDVRDWEINLKELQGHREKMIDVYQECGVKKTREKILEDIDREHWMGPEQTIEYGLADEILQPEVLKEWLGQG